MGSDFQIVAALLGAVCEICGDSAYCDLRIGVNSDFVRTVVLCFSHFNMLHQDISGALLSSAPLERPIP